MSRALGFCTALGLVVALPSGLTAQSRLSGVEIRGGVSVEWSSGDFSSLLVPQLDSAERALAGVGEWSASGLVSLIDREDRRLLVNFDGGIRQFVTGGFQSRNYAPREHTAVLAARYGRRVGGGWAYGEAGVRTRSVVDAPPMPVYLPPGYGRYDAAVGYRSPIRRDLQLDVRLSGERADFSAPSGLPALDLLDRSSVSLRIGATRTLSAPREELGVEGDLNSLRVYATYGRHSYPGQGLGVLRSDHALGLGAEYVLHAGRLRLVLGGEGLVSRSNSPRVEYNFARVAAQAGWPLTDRTFADVRGSLAVKRYVRPGRDALVPGEEADNGSVLSATVIHYIDRDVVGDAGDVAGEVGLDWRDVETNFTGAYYTRVRVSFSLVYWPSF